MSNNSRLTKLLFVILFSFSMVVRKNYVFLPLRPSSFRSASVQNVELDPAFRKAWVTTTLWLPSPFTFTGLTANPILDLLTPKEQHGVFSTPTNLLLIPVVSLWLVSLTAFHCWEEVECVKSWKVSLHSQCIQQVFYNLVLFDEESDNWNKAPFYLQTLLAHCKTFVGTSCILVTRGCYCKRSTLLV